MRRWTLVTALGLMLGALFTAGAPLSAQGMMGRNGGMMMGGNTARNFEVAWLTNMIDHHDMAVEMALLVEDRAIHDQFGELAEDIIDAQTAEIKQMQGWLKSWYGITYEPRMHWHDEWMLEQLAALTGRPFEIAWMQGMIPHHMMAVMEAHHALRFAVHPNLRKLAQAIIITQTQEIQDMTVWLREWYGVGPGHGGPMMGHMMMGHMM